MKTVFLSLPPIFFRVPVMQECIPAQDLPSSSDPTPLEGRPPPQKKPRRPRTGLLSLDSVLRKLQQEKLQEFQSDRPLIAPPPTPLESSPSPTTSTNPSTPPPTLTNQIILSTVTSQSTPPTDPTNQNTPPGASVAPPVFGFTQKLLSTPPHGLPSPLRASIRDLTQVSTQPSHCSHRSIALQPGPKQRAGQLRLIKFK